VKVDSTPRHYVQVRLAQGYIYIYIGDGSAGFVMWVALAYGTTVC